jgi:hypothetical protein
MAKAARAAHDKNGRFAVGNSGGPGRPRRPVEREYLRALNEAVSLDDWKDVVRGALTQAKEGDAKAREWLARYLIGERPADLIDLWADDVAGVGVGVELVKALVRFAEGCRERLLFHGQDMEEAARMIERNGVSEL